MLAERRGVQEPAVMSAPEYVSSRGVEAIELAASVGLVLDPWQELVLMEALGCKADGRWAAFEVGVDVPRQNGKGGVLEARELAGLFLWGEGLIIHSAHQFDTSIEAFLRMEDLLAGSPELASQVRSVSRSHGSEGFVLRTGQRLRYRTRTKGGGRGFTADTLILDEAMVLPDTFHAALLPTLSGRTVEGNPQVWYTGSAVDQLTHEHGVVFARIRERGLGGDPSLVYMEWSGCPVGDDGEPLDLASALSSGALEDEAAWAQANPGLGIRISAEHVAKELRSMDARAFAVERLGIGDWPLTDGSGAAVISIDRWDALADPVSAIVGPLGLAFDVSPDRSSTSISAAGLRADQQSHVEVVEHRRGTGWVVDRLVELCARHSPVAVLCDASGPAASLVYRLEEAGVTVTAVSAHDHAKACGMLYDLVDQDGVRHLGSHELRAAVKGAAKRPLGDAWAWSRKSSSVDISPLVACTLALWGSATAAKPRGLMPGVML